MGILDHLICLLRNLYASQEATDRTGHETMNWFQIGKGVRQGYGFSSSQYGCLSWTIKKAEHQKIDAFELWCWRRLLRVPWTETRSHQSILKEISAGCSLEGLMLKLKLEYFVHLVQRADSLEKSLMLGGIGGRRRRR